MPRLVAAPALQRLAFIGNYSPRQCGIATFTTDLCEAIAAASPETSCLAIPMNDTPTGYPYPERVQFEVVEKELASYRRAADFLNVNSVDLVCLQHEYGIFGGPAGSHILALLRELRMPVVTTLHTVLQSPNAAQRKVFEELAVLSDRFVVMSDRSQHFLEDIYGVPGAKIVQIPHGIPDVPFVDPNFYKDQFGVEGKTVLLTFGLISPNKGIEYVIQAMPTILQRHEDVVYLVVGATHPHLKRHEGEAYRLMLQRCARDVGAGRNVIFHNRFVSLNELVEFIGTADIYVTPYLVEEQAVSGTLAYSFGAGKAIVSTPYWYAQELLADERGLLVPSRDPEAIAQAVLTLMEHGPRRHAMRKRAYMAGRAMIWPIVAEQYLATFQRVREERICAPRPVTPHPDTGALVMDLPSVNVSHLLRMTDTTGILQHAIFTVPRYEDGYCTDDNARALALVILMCEIAEANEEARALASRYLAFLSHAFNPTNGRFRNFMSYDRRWLETVGSEDGHGRALWALGTAAGRAEPDGLQALANQLYISALPALLELTSPRAWAFGLLGIHEYLRRSEGHSESNHVRSILAERLLDRYRETHTEDWPWFEDRLVYANAKLPHSLIMCGRSMGNEEMVRTGLDALSWLTRVQRCEEEDHFVPIGCDTIYVHGGPRPRFDQQPVEAQATVSACLEAWRTTGEVAWKEEAHRAFEWFLGRNDLRISLYDSTTGGCRDGLHSDRANENQGAESTLAFLLARLEMQLAENVIPVL